MDDRSSGRSNDNERIRYKDNENIPNQREDGNEFILQPIYEVMMVDEKVELNSKWKQTNEMMDQLMSNQQHYEDDLKRIKSKEDTTDSTWNQKDKEQYPLLNVQTGPKNWSKFKKHLEDDKLLSDYIIYLISFWNYINTTYKSKVNPPNVFTT